MKKIVYVILVFLLFSNVYANQKSDDILRVIMNADGYINEALYNEYWKQFKSKPPASELEKAKKISTIALQNQYHIWNAVKLSAKYKKVVKTVELENAISYMKELNSYKAIESTNMILKAAADGTPADIRGQKQYITEDLCDEVLSGLSASIERVNMLLSRAWKPVVKERRLEPWLSVLSTLPFVRTDIVVNNIKQNQYSLKLNEENRQIIATMQNQRKDTSASTDDCIKGIAESIGLEAKLIKKNTFQGESASSSSLVIKDKGDNTFVEAICVNYDTRLMSVITMSTSIKDADDYHNSLLKSIKLK